MSRISCRPLHYMHNTPYFTLLYTRRSPEAGTAYILIGSTKAIAAENVSISQPEI